MVGSLDLAYSDEVAAVPVADHNPEAVLATVPVAVAHNLEAAVDYILEERTALGKMVLPVVVDMSVALVVAGNSAEAELRMVADYTVVGSAPESENSVQESQRFHPLDLGNVHLRK